MTTPVAVLIAGELHGVDDAIAAAAVLTEIRAGRDHAADRLAVQAGLDTLTIGQLAELAVTFDVEV